MEHLHVAIALCNHKVLISAYSLDKRPITFPHTHKPLLKSTVAVYTYSVESIEAAEIKPCRPFRPIIYAIIYILCIHLELVLVQYDISSTSWLEERCIEVTVC